MAILSSLRKESRESRSLTGPYNMSDPALVDLFSSRSNSNSAQVVTSDTAMNVSAFYACVNRISKTIAMIPLNVMRKLPNGGKEIAPDHRFQKMVSLRPNRWQTSYDWRMFMQGSTIIKGNGYSKIVFVPGRGQNEFVPLEADRVWPYVITPNGATYYMYENSPAPPAGSKLYYQHFPINGPSEVILSDEMIHLRGYSSNGIVGKKTVTLMRECLGLAMATEEHGARLFSNGAQVSKVYTVPHSLSDQTYERLKEQVNGGDFSGVHNSHKSMILEEGMDVTKISLTSEEAQFLESRRFQVEDIASFLDVPLFLINRSSDKNQTFASAEVIELIFGKYMMGPHYVNWEQTLARDLLWPSELSEYYFDLDSAALMRGDTKARAEYLDKRFGMASITPDEIRMYEGESPSGTEEGKKYYLKSGMVPASMAGMLQTQQSKDPAKDPKEDPAKDPTKESDNGN